MGPKVRLREHLKSGEHIAFHNLARDSQSDILKGQDGTLEVVPSDGIWRADALAHIYVGPWGVKLEAIANDVIISPIMTRQHQQTPLVSEVYQLKRPSINSRSEIIFLREDDVVYFPSVESRLALILDFDEIQVNSSVPAEASELQDLDPPLLASKKLSQEQSSSKNDEVIIVHSNPQHALPLPRSTPILSVSRSEVVEETPASKHKQFRFVETSSFTASRQESEVTGDYSVIFLHYNEQVEGPQLLDGSADPKHSHPSIEPLTSRSQSSDNEVQRFSTASAGVSQHKPTASDNGAIEDTGLTGEHQSHSTTSQEMPESPEDDDIPTSAEPSFNPTSNFTPIVGLSDVAGSAEDSTEDEDEPEEIPRRGRRVLEGVHIPSPNKSAKKRLSSSPSIMLDTDEEVRRPLYTRRLIKRTKTTNDRSQDSRLEEIVVDTRLQGSISKVRRQSLSDTAEIPTPVVPQASQKSIAEKDLYNHEEPPRVVFSNSTVSDKTQLLKFLHKHGGSVVDKVSETDSNVLCVGKNSLRKTGKLLLSIALGMRIVTDEWFFASSKAEHLLNTDAFIPHDPDREKEWGFSMSAIVGKPQRNLLEGKTLYITPALKKDYGKGGFKEIEEIAKTVGVEKVISKPARDVKDADYIMLALQNGDLDAATLHEYGRKCFHKDLLSNSILRGHLDLDSDEFKVEPPSSQPKKTKKKRNS